MPRCSGGVATFDIVAKHAENAPYCVAFTADSATGVHTRCRAAGFAAVLFKPGRLTQIKSILAECRKEIRPLQE